MLPFGQTVYQKKLGLGLDPNPNQKQKSIWLKFNSIHYGIEINKCLQFLTQNPNPRLNETQFKISATFW